jgi:hypothetical protein
VSSSNATLNVNAMVYSQPTLGSPQNSSGHFSFSVNGDVGPNYLIQTSTNLADTNWATLFSTNPSGLPFTFVDTNTSELPAQFYRVLISP